MTLGSGSIGWAWAGLSGLIRQAGLSEFIGQESLLADFDDDGDAFDDFRFILTF